MFTRLFPERFDRRIERLAAKEYLERLHLDGEEWGPLTTGHAPRKEFVSRFFTALSEGVARGILILASDARIPSLKRALVSASDETIRNLAALIGFQYAATYASEVPTSDYSLSQRWEMWQNFYQPTSRVRSLLKERIGDGFSSYIKLDMTQAIYDILDIDAKEIKRVDFDHSSAADPDAFAALHAKMIVDQLLIDGVARFLDVSTKRGLGLGGRVRYIAKTIPIQRVSNLGESTTTSAAYVAVAVVAAAATAKAVTCILEAFFDERAGRFYDDQIHDLATFVFWMQMDYFRAAALSNEEFNSEPVKRSLSDLLAAMYLPSPVALAVIQRLVIERQFIQLNPKIDAIYQILGDDPAHGRAAPQGKGLSQVAAGADSDERQAFAQLLSTLFQDFKREALDAYEHAGEQGTPGA